MIPEKGADSSSPMTPGEASKEAALGEVLARLEQSLHSKTPDPLADAAPSPGSSSSPTGELVERLAAQGPRDARYRIEGEIGRGGMGAILKVFDPDLRRTLAMKVALERETPEDERKRRERTVRFLEEAQVTGQLDHPGVVPVHELGLDSHGQLYFTMRLVRGRDLGAIYGLARANEDGWTTTRVLGALLRVCEAMAYAHSKSVIHRDLKPSNVMVGRFGEVYVMDWGLAKVIGRSDAHDLRVVPDTASSLELKSVRSEEHAHDPNTPLVTMDGTVLGTPAYMSPEQARGEIEAMDARSDVYSLGSMLYHLLAGHAPYQDGEEKPAARQLWMGILKGPPTPLAEIAPETPPELIAIVERAMAREQDQRYPDMLSLAEDLRAWLEGRVVRAYESGVWAESRKWIGRNKSLAASLVAAVAILIGGAAASSYFAVDAKEQAERADIKAAEALSNEALAKLSETRALEQERQATQARDDVLSLSTSKDLEDLLARADDLWPADPTLVEAYEKWLADARELIEGRAGDPQRGLKARHSLEQHVARLAQLRAQASTQSEAELLAERESHPQYAELVDKQAELRWNRMMLGQEPWPSEATAEAELAREPANLDASALNALAWALVNPSKPKHGQAMKALLLARRALPLAGQGERSAIHESLAWANFELGRFDEALKELGLVLDDVSANSRASVETRGEQLERAVDSWQGAELSKRRENCAALASQVTALERSVGERQHWEFVDPDTRWWHVQLSQLVAGLKSLQDPASGLLGDNVNVAHGWSVPKRLAFAQTIRERSIDGASPKALWEKARAAIAASANYAGLDLVPQLGLLPIGVDNDSGLWEFAHLQTGQPTQRGADGKLVITEDTGLVFVLIPGGKFLMGSQAFDPTGDNYNPHASTKESPVHEVTLSPYFLSKYEMTQGQWMRIAGQNPSFYGPATTVNGGNNDLAHPVEQVSWTMCMELMKRLDLSLPSEAQWECGCRGGTRTPWWSGSDRESLRGKINLADQSAKRNGAAWPAIEDWPDFDDGWTVHARIGSLAANPFGLHEVSGNVFEWCRDGFKDYSRVRQVDPVAPVDEVPTRVNRGAGFSNAAKDATSSSRGSSPPDNRNRYLGLRPARSVAP